VGATNELEYAQLMLHTYTEDAYLQYAIATVKDRALAQVQDGQKPVQRRILFAMHELGLVHDAKPVKSARIVGEVLGKYHPHGDGAAYAAMVRMAQDFTLRYPLISGQGNFGSRDGDPAAAMRYTEARLSPIAQLLLSELRQGTVDFQDNYDGTQKEPELLPARLPMLLLNGTTGIAVGMASDLPPHNLREVARAAAAIVARPDTSDETVLDAVPGPDFPDGGQVISSAADIAAAYRSGRGSLRMRARWTVEELARGQWQIVVTELPYQVSTKRVLEQVDALTNPKAPAGKKQITQQQANLRQLALEFLENARDESGKADKVRLVLVPRTSKVDRDAMMAFLLANTSLEDTVGVNFTTVGLDGRPGTRGFPAMLREWATYRVKTVHRRFAWELGQAESRIHVLEGRLTVLLNLDEVIAVIRSAESPREELMARFGLSEVQAEDILEMRLRQLNRLEHLRLQKELDDLKKTAARLKHLLENDAALRKEVVNEIEADAAKYGDERRTLLEAAERTGSAVALTRSVLDEPITVFVSKSLWVRQRAGHDVEASSVGYRTGDSEGWVLRTRTAWPVVFLDSRGRVYSVAGADVPASRGDGVPLSTLIEVQDGAQIVQAFTADPESLYLFSGESGYGFVAPLKSCVARPRAGKAFLTVGPTERPLAAVAVPPDMSGLVGVVSSDGRALAFPLAEVKTLAGGGKGVVLMGLADDARVTTLQHLARVQLTGTAEKYQLHRGRKGCKLEKRGKTPF
jgi:topoisomerase-4 subunit A